ncbi:lamin tail domain-containing protein [Kurthia sp. Dielmo]|uniref:lamin tail domain-containing protein n=1 Tax=Kurthia sp. Dielmo TaxID=1033738 RepID=UPI00111FDE32|nr:lamin tail domain-containing protein [Kurthia sp. Dielmo]
MKKIVKNILTASAIITSTTLIATEGHAANAQQTIPFNTLNLSSIIKPNSTSSFIHTPPESAGPLQDLTISTAFNSSSVSNVVLNYHTELDNEWKQLEMVQVNNKYEAVLTPDLRQGQNITYYMTATVNGDQEYSDEFTVYENQPEYKPEKVPSLLITEVMARTTKIGDTEAYEYIEVYNNSTSTINLKDYNIQYRYPSKGAKGDLIWPVQQKEDLNLEPGKAMVFWITNDDNRQLSIQDFNAHYQTALEEGKQVVRIEGSGLTNGSYRGVAIATNTRTDISTAFYNQDEKNLDVGLNQAIVYAYPIDGKKECVLFHRKRQQVHQV